MSQTREKPVAGNIRPLNKAVDVYERFRHAYQQGHLDAAQLADLYASDVVFRDPVHTIQGLPALSDYFAALGKNLNTCRFEFVEELVTPAAAHITWHMRFSHRRIAGGREQCVRGMTLVRMANNRIIYHEDSYDAGAMVYEHLPVLGRLVRAVKSHMAGH